MTFTVQSLLVLPVVARARPEVLHGDDLDRREVRWVHTSEIYDIAPLLKGGEVLLTTGLGLVGASPEQLRAYVRELADRGVAALCLELGRTFPRMPEPLLQAARATDLVLVAFHDVVPFVEVTELVHQRLVSQEVESLRNSQWITAELTDSLLSGSGLSGLMQRTAALAGCRAALVAADGRLVAGSEDRSDAVVPAQEAASRPVEVFGVQWGRLLLDGPPTAHRIAVLDQVAVAVALELVRSGGLAPARRQAGRQLLRDIASERFASAEQLAARAAAVGLLPRRGHALLAVCFGVDATTSLRVAVEAAADAGRRLLGSPVVAHVGDDVLLVGSVPGGDDAAVRALLVQLADAVDHQLRATTGGRVLGLAAGSPVQDVPGLVRSVRVAREASVLARRLGTGVRTLLAADVGVHRLLSRLLTDPDLERFVDEQLGALLEHDARYGRELVRTLDAHLAHGMSKTRTAQALGVRRQTLYDRLDRIERLLGCPDLEQRERRTALDLALLAWRLRSSAAR